MKSVILVGFPVPFFFFCIRDKGREGGLFWVTPGNVQKLIPALHSAITPEVLREPNEVLGAKPGLVAQEQTPNLLHYHTGLRVYIFK